MVIYPPTKIPVIHVDGNKQWVFLAGTIDMGNSGDWQLNAVNELKKRYNIMNPRRKEWDNSWEQKLENPNFFQQVNWELTMLDKADIILFNFEKGSKSPITLLELGYNLGKGKEIYVCCPEGYERKGNVDIICDREGVEVFEDIKILINHLIFKE